MFEIWVPSKIDVGGAGLLESRDHFLRGAEGNYVVEVAVVDPKTNTNS